MLVDQFSCEYDHHFDISPKFRVCISADREVYFGTDDRVSWAYRTSNAQ